LEQIMMFARIFVTLASRVERRMERGRRSRDENYLAQATDCADLERRQRLLTRPRAYVPFYG
jgi:hypothetical protein